MDTNVRQSNLKVNVEGVVSENALEKKVEDGMTKITGYLTVKTSDINFVRFNVNINEKTKAGAENKAFAGIETVMNEYKSIADVGEDQADRVRVSGDINLYRSQNGNDVISYKSNFFNRVKDNYNPHAEFSAETYINAIVPEMDSEGNETGRVIVKGWSITYNGAEAIAFVADKDLADAITSTFEVGQTVEFYGDLVNNKIEKITEIPVAIGKPKTKVETTYKNELLITGASAPYEDGVTPELPYEASVINAAVQERENRIAEAKANAQNKANSAAKPSGAAHGRTLGF